MPHTPDITLAYIGGGSLNWAQVLMGDLAQDGAIAGEVRLYDIDQAAAARNAALGNRLSKTQGQRLRYAAPAALAEALDGADFVVVSILPGSFEDMAHDIDLPAAAGVLQSVGDTVGPGGFLRAMRAIPEMAAIAQAIGVHCPRAYVCNLTNPMSALTGAMYAAFPGIRAWGSCHEVVKLRHIVAWLANRRAGAIRHGFRDVAVNVLGINHFTFVDQAVVDGRDLLPDYLAFAAEHRARGWRARPIDPTDEHQRYFEDVNRVKFDLACRFGIAAAAGDRHLAEFLPASWYLDRHEAFGFGLTPVDYRIRDRAAKRAAAAAAEAAPSPPPLHPASEEPIVAQIRALAGGAPVVVNANLPNRGQLDGFADGTVVETNALFSGAGVQPVRAGRLPAALELVVRPHADRQTALVEATLKGDVATLEALFLTDPLTVPLGPDRAARLFRDMVRATAARLPETLRRITA